MVFARARRMLPNVTEYPGQLLKNVDEDIPEYFTGVFLTIGGIAPWIFLLGLLISIGDLGFGISEFILETTFPSDIPIVGGTVVLPVLMMTGVISFPLAAIGLMSVSEPRENLMDDWWSGVLGSGIVLLVGSVQEMFVLSDVGRVTFLAAAAAYTFAWLLHLLVGGVNRFRS